jgi:transaldolase
MKLFVDDAPTGEIAHAIESWAIDGLATNPRHIQGSGKPSLRSLDENAGLFAGTDKPVSIEVKPHLTEA